MSDRLTALEFVAVDDGPLPVPQVVRLRRGDAVLIEFQVFRWLGWFVPAACGELLTFASRADLIIEGRGLGRTYWNDEMPPWVGGASDPKAEARRIEQIRRAAADADRAGSVLTMGIHG